jgi:hypothetical protein
MSFMAGKNWPSAIILFVLSILSVTMANAEISRTSGLKFGMGVSTIRGSIEKYSVAVKGAFSGGVFVTYTIHPNFALQPEILLLKKGAKLDSLIFGFEQDTSEVVMLNYIEIPVLAKLIIPNSTRFTPYLYGGPAFSILISATLKTKFDEIDIDEAEGSEFSLVFGGGVDIAIENVRVTVDARIMEGMTQFLKGPFIINRWNATNRGFLIMVGIAL